MVWLAPGTLASALVYVRSPTTYRTFPDEWSHYLGPLQRLLDGQALVQRVHMMFTAALIQLLRAWMHVMGYTLGAMVEFFALGWAIYLGLLGILVVQVTRRAILPLVLVGAFALWWMPEAPILVSWGGVRYLPGLAMLILCNACTNRPTSTTWWGLTGVALVPLASIAPEQVVITVLAVVGQVVLTWPITDRCEGRRPAVASACLGVFCGALAMVPGDHLRDLSAYLRQLPTFAVWRQPITPRIRSNAISILGMCAPVWMLWLRERYCSPRRPWTASDRVLIRVSVFIVGQFLYALRAFDHEQGLMATGLLLLGVALLLADLARRAPARRLVSVLAIAYGVGVLALRPDAVPALVDRVRHTVVGPLPGCRAGCRETRTARLQGAALPMAHADELDAVIEAVRTRWAVTGDSTFLVFPEHAFLEFALNHSAVGDVPIAALATTTATWRSDLVDTLYRQPPATVIRFKRLGNFAKSIGQRDELLPEIGALLDREYDVEQDLPHFQVLRRRAETSGSPPSSGHHAGV